MRTESQLLFNFVIWKIETCFSAADGLHGKFKTSRTTSCCSESEPPSSWRSLDSWLWTSLEQRKGLQGPLKQLPPPRITTNLWGAKHFLGVNPLRYCHRLVLLLFEFLSWKSRKVFWHWARFLWRMHTKYLFAQQNTISLYLRASRLLTTFFLITSTSDSFRLTQCPSSSLHSPEELSWCVTAPHCYTTVFSRSSCTFTNS